MVVKVNNNGVYIDMSANPTLAALYGTEHVVIPSSYIASINTYNHPDLGEVIRITDKVEDEYFIHHSMVTSINTVTGWTSSLDVFLEFINKLYGL